MQREEEYFKNLLSSYQADSGRNENNNRNDKLIAR